MLPQLRQRLGYTCLSSFILTLYGSMFVAGTEINEVLFFFGVIYLYTCHVCMASPSASDACLLRVRELSLCLSSLAGCCVMSVSARSCRGRVFVRLFSFVRLLSGGMYENHFTARCRAFALNAHQNKPEQDTAVY